MYYPRLMKIVVIAVMSSLATGCANNPHNDVLIFGTNTKVAFDVSPDPANAGVPSFTLGYKRQEVALVPLKANGPLSKDDSTDRKYIGTDGVGKDTYSVFASFGGEFSSGKDNNTRVALSQFFATGIAAQNLGRSSSASNMVSVQPVDAKILEKQESINALQKQLSEEKVKSISIKQKKIVSDRMAKAAIIVMNVTNVDGSINTTRLTKAVKDGKVKAPWDATIPTMKTKKALNDILVGHVDDVDVNALYEQLK